MSFASCMLKQLLLVSARQVVKTTALYERTSSPWFKPHKLHFLSKAINLCFEMRAIYTAVYFQQSSRTARCCGPISSAKTQCACGAGFDSHYISIAWYVHTCWGFKSRGRTWHVFLTMKFLPGKITPHLDFACCC